MDCVTACRWCGRDECDDADSCAAGLAWERSVLCRRCGEPSGIHPMTLKANGATSVMCAACAQATNPVDP